jgi:hypothetical protein
VGLSPDWLRLTDDFGFKYAGYRVENCCNANRGSDGFFADAFLAQHAFVRIDAGAASVDRTNCG